MNFQILYAQILGILKGILIANQQPVTDVLMEFYSGTVTRFELIAQQKLNGEFASDDDFKSALLREKDIFLSELDALKIIGYEIVQDAANTIIALFESALTAVKS